MRPTLVAQTETIICNTCRAVLGHDETVWQGLDGRRLRLRRRRPGGMRKMDNLGQFCHRPLQMEPAHGEYLTLRDVAELLKLSDKTVYRLAQGGGIPAFKAGGSCGMSTNVVEVRFGTAEGALLAMKEQGRLDMAGTRARLEQAMGLLTEIIGEVVK